MQTAIDLIDNYLTISGVPGTRVLGAAAIIAVALTFSRIFSLSILRHIQRLMQKTKTTMDDELVEILRRPVGWLIVLGCLWTTHLILAEYLNSQFREILSKGVSLGVLVILAVIICRVSKFPAQLLKKLAKRTRTKIDDLIVPYVPPFIQAVTVLFCFFVVLTTVRALAKSWIGLPEGCPPDCIGADLRDKDLTAIDLSRADLSGADLKEAGLRGADLKEADLSGANLEEANLEKADLSKATLKGANLKNANLCGVILSETDLSGANLTGAVLTRVNLTTVNLTAAVLDKARLIGANLSGADLRGAKLRGADLRGAKLSGADLTGADLSGEVNLSGADLSGTLLNGASLDDAYLVGTYLFGANLDGASLNASLYGADLSGANLNGADLQGANVVGVSLFGATLVNTNLSEANLNGVDLREANLRRTELEYTDINGYEIDDKTPTEANGKITLYTSVPQLIADRIQADFQLKFPDITLDVFRAGTSQVVAKVMTEKETGNIQADLIWVAEPATYEALKDQDILLKYVPPESVFMPPEMKDPEEYYYAGRLINMIVGYNTTVTTPPKGWQDLLEPEYQGKQGFVSPWGSGAAEVAVKTLVDTYGWKYFEDLEANGGAAVRNNSTLRDQLSTGELMIGALLDYTVREAKDQGTPIDYVWPEEGAVSIPSPLAILNTTQNPLAAKVFVDYVLSKDGQETIVKLGNFMPVRYDVDPPDGTPSLLQIKKLPTDWKAMQKNRQATQDRWTAIFGE